jgi:RNA polymerase sigma factor (sigma-70 family)
MDRALRAIQVTVEDRRIAETIVRERNRLLNFIRKRVGDMDDAQDVFYELVEATRLMKPIEHVSAWLFRVARNRITDLFRTKKAHVSTDGPAASEGEEPRLFGDLLPSPGAGPEATLAHQVLLEELEAAVDELPDDLREVFIAHELEGRSFKELAAETGLSVNTLLGRKHYAVLRLRRRLQAIHDEFRTA